jgi:hypothetical protein
VNALSSQRDEKLGQNTQQAEKTAEFSDLFGRRVTILAGHFGSGKTEITINAALSMARSQTRVSVVDLDVVKPYFRSRSAKNFLERAGVDLVAPGGEYYSSDLPIILPEIRSLLRDPSRKLLMDAGGDDTGVRAVASLTDIIPREETDFFLVLNFRRPFTPDVDSAVDMIRQIEATSRLTVTGILSNTHLMEETTPEIVRDGYAGAMETARRAGTRLVAVTVGEAVRSNLDQRDFQCPLVVLRRIVKPPFEASRREQTVGPLFVVG